MTRASNAIGQHKTNRMHHRKKAAMATSLRNFESSRRAPARSFRLSQTLTTGKAEKFHPRGIRSVRDALPPTTESQHQAACANRRSPNAGRAPEHESMPGYDLRPVAAVWKA